jgi:hypothetical protein
MRKVFAMVFCTLALAAPAMAAGLQAELMAMEKVFWTAWGKKDGEPFKKHLTADAVEMYQETPID